MKKWISYIITSTPLKIGFIGLGWAARSIWIPRFINHAAFRIVAGYDPSLDVRSLVREITPDLLFESSIDTLLEQDLDLIVISSPNTSHVTHACRCLYKGISVLIEKPVCLSRTDYKILRQAATNSAGHCLTSNAARMRKDVQLLTNELKGCGTLDLIEVEWIRSRGIPSPGSWFTNSSLSGGGVLFDLGWHMLDIAFSLNSYSPPISACAVKSDAGVKGSYRNQANWRGIESIEALDIDVEDTVRGLIHTQSGCAISIHVAWSSHYKRDRTLVRAHTGGETYELQTTFGFTPNRIATPTLSIFKDQNKRTIDYPSMELGDEYDVVVDNISHSMNDAVENGKVLKEIDAVTSSIGMLYHSADSLVSIEKAS